MPYNKVLYAEQKTKKQASLHELSRRKQSFRKKITMEFLECQSPHKNRSQQRQHIRPRISRRRRARLRRRSRTTSSTGRATTRRGASIALAITRTPLIEEAHEDLRSIERGGILAQGRRPGVAQAKHLEVRDLALLRALTKLVLHRLLLERRVADVRCRQAGAGSPLGDPMGDRRQAEAATVAAIVRNRVVGGTVEFNHRDVLLGAVAEDGDVGGVDAVPGGGTVAGFVACVCVECAVGCAVDGDVG